MVFSSLSFIFIFLSTTLLLYFLPLGRVYKNAILLAASLFFYAWGEPVLILVMIFVCFVAYICGLFIEKYWFVKPKACFAWTVIATVIIVGNLIFYKYYGFILENIALIAPRLAAHMIVPEKNFMLLEGLSVSFGNVKLPIGISFYSFQILSYILDLYKGRVYVQRNFFKLLLYVSFFPQLIAGPIVRYQTVEDELDKRDENILDISWGLKRFIVGLAKKVIIANGIAPFVDTVYTSDFSVFGSAMLWLAALAYSLQLYFDFSAYSDMAIGLGRIFGFHFPENFDYPYIAASITDFWRRWHISLSSWFKDYVYIPLGGNKKGAPIQILNLIIVWALTGLWHGASWNFVIWGLYYCILLIIEKFVLGDILEAIPRIFRWIFMFLAVNIGWVIFYNTDFASLKSVIITMFSFTPTNWIEVFTESSSLLQSAIYFIPGLIFIFPIGRLTSKLERHNFGLLLSNIWYIILLFICVFVMISSKYNPFIYFRF